MKSQPIRTVGSGAGGASWTAVPPAGYVRADHRADIPALPCDRQMNQLMAGQDGARRFRLVVW
jgi:hypothetical protein